MVKDTHIQIRLSSTQKKVVEKNAKTQGLSISQYLLNLIEKDSSFDKKLTIIINEILKNGLDPYLLSEFSILVLDLSNNDLLKLVEKPFSSNCNGLSLNYLLATLETELKRRNLELPEWFGNIKSLKEPWFGTNLKSLRGFLLLNSPLAFRRRNIFIDSLIGSAK